MKSMLILFAITAATLVGDYCIKLASERTSGVTSYTFYLGAILYALPAVGWFFLMRQHSLATIGVFYSASTIILLAALGYFVFKENFGMREMVGIMLAVASVVVMSHET